MKPPTGLRARHLSAFTAEVARKKAVVASIWLRDEGKCVLCQRPVMPPQTAQTRAASGYVKWRDPLVITAEGGHLVCGQHFNRNVIG